jgi:hypothetical protein
MKPVKDLDTKELVVELYEGLQLEEKLESELSDMGRISDNHRAEVMKTKQRNIDLENEWNERAKKGK